MTDTAWALASSRFKTEMKGGAGVGRLIVNDNVDQWECHYDMLLVERIQGRPKLDSGLFLPNEDLPRLHLCRVIAMGPGREEENGLVAPMPAVKIGDIVVAKNPWGIGPKDEETTDGRKYSFMRSQDLTAVISGGVDEDDVM
jgi:co-chaperonin GroES (HSP10)